MRYVFVSVFTLPELLPWKSVIWTFKVYVFKMCDLLQDLVLENLEIVPAGILFVFVLICN